LGKKGIGDIKDENYGIDILPVTLLDGEIVKQKNYPTLTEFSNYLQQNLSRVKVQ